MMDGVEVGDGAVERHAIIDKQVNIAAGMSIGTDTDSDAARYTGAVLQKFFGRSIGVTVTSLALAFWVFGPLLAGMRAFQKKDF